MPPKKPRVSLTKTQIQEAVGAELLALCQSVTADGVLTGEEIAALRDWLDEHRNSDLPAIEFLAATVDRILADGKVTPDERKELYAAIEKVLPPEVRREAASQRKAVEAEEKATAKRQREEQKEQERAEREEQKRQERAERERNRPVYSFNFMVAGAPYKGRSAVVSRHVAEGDTVYLVRDPRNPFSRNAVEVRLANGMMVGFVPEDYAPDVAPLLDEGLPHKAEVVKTIGYKLSIPVVHASFHRADSDEPGLVSPSQVPAPRPEGRPSRVRAEPAQQRGRRGREELPSVPRSRSASAGKGCLLILPLVCAALTCGVMLAVVAFG